MPCPTPCGDLHCECLYADCRPPWHVQGPLPPSLTGKKQKRRGPIHRLVDMATEPVRAWLPPYSPLSGHGALTAGSVKALLSASCHGRTLHMAATLRHCIKSWLRRQHPMKEMSLPAPDKCIIAPMLTQESYTVQRPLWGPPAAMQSGPTGAVYVQGTPYYQEG